MTVATHIKTLCRNLNFQLRNIGRVRRFLDHDTCHLVVCALVLSRVDYGNGLLLGANTTDIQRLQRIQNWAAKLICLVTNLIMLDHAFANLSVHIVCFMYLLFVCAVILMV